MGLSKSRPYIFPTPAHGHCGVGCADIMINKNQQNEDIFARIFYPTDRKDNYLSDVANLPVWIPQQKRIIDGLAAYRGESPRKLQFLFNWVLGGGDRLISASWHDKLSTNVACLFPVLIFSHGLGSCRHFYSVFCSAIASHGYVVMSVEHRDRSACYTYTLNKDDPETEIPIEMHQLTPTDDEFKLRNSQLHTRVSECIKALHVLGELHLGKCGIEASNPKENTIVLGGDFDWTQFKERLDLSSASISGHSFGGVTAIASTAICTDFQSAIVLDGWMFPLDADLYQKAKTPLLLLNAQGWQWVENVRKMYRFDGFVAERLMLTFRNALHYSFTNFAHLNDGFIARKLGIFGEIDALLCTEAVVNLTLGFLRKHSGASPEEDPMPEIIGRYDFLIKGTTLNLDEGPNFKY